MMVSLFPEIAALRAAGLPACPDFQEPGIVGEHALDLPADLAPIVDEVAGLVTGHHRDALFLENGEYLLRAGATLGSLAEGDTAECVGDALELLGDAKANGLRPLDLGGRTD